MSGYTKGKELAELGQKVQITILKEIIVKLGLSEYEKMIILVDEEQNTGVLYFLVIPEVPILEPPGIIFILGC